MDIGLKRLWTMLLVAALSISSLAVSQTIQKEQEQESERVSETQDAAEPVDELAEQNTEADNWENESAEGQPDADLRSRSLGDAFKNFTPSEEISADNAVSFPVDI